MDRQEVTLVEMVFVTVSETRSHDLGGGNISARSWRITTMGSTNASTDLHASNGDDHFVDVG